MGSQLSWESTCLTSRGSQVRALLVPYAGVAELADAQDLKSCGTYLPYRFDSGRRHYNILCYNKFYNMWAQLSWIERLATDQKVGGSNPLAHVQRYRQMVRHRILIPAFSGSNPDSAAQETLVSVSFFVQENLFLKVQPHRQNFVAYKERKNYCLFSQTMV